MPRVLEPRWTRAESLNNIEYMTLDPSDKKQFFETLCLKHDPMYDQLAMAVAIVKQFIVDKNLIIYGGTAIDYALRLRGESIYDDAALTIPDLDFYSPKSVEDSYELADLLYAAGCELARSIVGMHVDTMRVDAGANHFIADIHAVPAEIFAMIPTLIYEGMRVVHPHFQRIDSHNSLAFPFDDPPREVIFNRWEKDIKRFNIMHRVYPLDMPMAPLAKKTTLDLSTVKSWVLCGATAMAVLLSEYKVHGTAITFDSPRGVAEIACMRLDKVDMPRTAKYEALGGIFPARMETAGIHFYSTHHALLSVVTRDVAGVHIRVACPQYLLRLFAAQGIIHQGTPLGADAWWRYDRILRANLGLSVDTYGAENISHSRRVALQRLYYAIDHTAFAPVPVNYVPANGGIRPTFDYEANPLFSARGRLTN
jgi:hypothetical protein